jgi:PKD repeat protein
MPSAPRRRAGDSWHRVPARRRAGARAFAAALSGALLLLLAAAAAADPPTNPSFTFSPAVPAVGQNVAFSGTATDADEALSFAWSFGDGASSSGSATAAHAYATNGTKTVTMTATNAANQSVSATRQVRVNAPPTARIVFSTVSPLPGQDPLTPLVGQQVAFAGTTSSDPEGPIAAYSWDLDGDGTFGDSTASSALASYSTAGLHTVRLRVTDSDGATGLATVQFRVNRPPVASFTFAPQTPAAGAVVHFTSTSTDPDGAQDIVAQDWDLNGDGVYGDATGPAASATFGPGTHAVGLRVTDSGRATAFAEESVTVPGAGAPTAAAGSPAPGGSAGGANPTSSTSSSTSSGTGLRLLLGVRIQIAGTFTAAGTRITRLLVTAPRGTLITASCSGGSCHLRRLRVHVGRRSVRLRRFERSLHAGTHLSILVSRSGFIGRTALFTIRRGRPPLRRDLCLAPGARRASTCPVA